MIRFHWSYPFGFDGVDTTTPWRFRGGQTIFYRLTEDTVSVVTL